MCAPKTKVIYLWKPASLSIFFSSHPNWCSAHILYFIFLFHVIQQLLHLTPLLMSLHLHFISFLQWLFSIPASYQNFHWGRGYKESWAQAWESHIPDCIVHGEYWKSAYFSHDIREHEFSVMGLYKLWVNCPLFSNMKNRRMWSEVAWACNGGDLGSIPEWGRSPGEQNGYPLQYSCLENFMDRGAWQATVRGVAKSWTWLTNFHTFRKTNKDLLYTTGNSTQYSVMTCKGKESKKMDVCIIDFFLLYIWN